MTTALKKLTENQVKFDCDFYDRGSVRIIAKYINFTGYSSKVSSDIWQTYIHNPNFVYLEQCTVPEITELKKEAIHYLQQNIQQVYNKITEELL